MKPRQTSQQKSQQKKKPFKSKKNFSVSSQVIPPLLVWGKHVVETYLEKLQLDLQTLSHTKQRSVYGHISHSSDYLLHILVDKSGKTPSQLERACDLAKFVKIKIITHRSEQEGWPLKDVHEGIVHQRICLQIPEYPAEDISFACESIKKYQIQNEFGCVGIVLDQVQDPRNFGAILRSAAFFGVKFVVYAQNRQAGISPLVLKASAGGAFEVALIPVVNINRALEELKQAGSWILGTGNANHPTQLHQLPTDRVWVCVFGNEGSGLRPDVIKNCDFMTKIAGGTKTLDSLNVSVATGIILHSLQDKNLCLA